ncbi:MAG: hypothetical protein SCH71_15625 [Desulfobulbaceae bacterium]|nr:hypothetical protein [Desulfobulbaceae bacterium]
MGDAAASSAGEKAAGIADGISEKTGSFFEKIGDVIEYTNIPQQVSDVDAGGLFTNPWFMVPFIALLGWQLFRQSFKDMIIVLLVVGLWWVSGTHYMQTLIIDGELQINKVLPVMFGGAAILGFIIYMYFGRS